MPHSTTPSFAQLVDWIEGRLTEEKAEPVATYAATADTDTQADITWLRAFKRLSQAVILTDPPPEVRALLTRRFAMYQQGQPQPSLLQRLVSSLTFDSHATAATAGLRAAIAHGQQRQCIYSTHVADVALNIQSHHHGRSFNINGQVFPIEYVALESLSVQMLHDTTEWGITMANEVGEFTFEAVPSGIYELIVSGDRIEIVITSVELYQ
jgi:hypothetical protein